MSDSEVLEQILSRLTGLKDGQRKLEDGQRKLEDGQRGLKRMVEGQQVWFQTLGQKVEALEGTVAAVRGEIRDLMTHL